MEVPDAQGRHVSTSFLKPILCPPRCYGRDSNKKLSYAIANLSHGRALARSGPARGATRGILEPIDFGPAWWPDGLGWPASSGAHGGARYAFFPDRRRLAVQRDGEVALYDSGGHRITGVSQGQCGGGAPVFTSQEGEVELGRLAKVG